jgi:hypothetical protein
MLASVVVSAMDYGSMTQGPRQGFASLPRSPAALAPKKLQNVMAVTDVLALFWRPHHN